MPRVQIFKIDLRGKYRPDGYVEIGGTEIFAEPPQWVEITAGLLMQHQRLHRLGNGLWVRESYYGDGKDSPFGSNFVYMSESNAKKWLMGTGLHDAAIQKYFGEKLSEGEEFMRQLVESGLAP